MEISYSPIYCEEGPPELVRLIIEDCENLCLSKTPLFVNAWAPDLTYLDIRFIDDWKPIQEFHQFNLADLTHLTIRSSYKFDSLQCFSNCKNLSHLSLVRFGKDKQTKFSESIMANIFPKLKVLSFYTHHSSITLDSLVDLQLFPIDVFCKSKEIELRVLCEETYHGTLYDGSMLHATPD
ncbi:uncharacterized protein MELLADRAFT_71120 [Melampsora larici-populina 98AG31]|uniref:F-box domain-containing protein n=1 Tax=Melampsora larici-populina (strain 98AG31 / pathotype 3-4-7) TaxID=747676 RepID=F4RCG5_MELLP|nr:uncharacterized protein MELLADRAFT_71120 [Melampsora larici-populina 98AG31]EGG09966.1 hypothetical protein MELLADRAFT_71120 [Melampsora larici-populina 98AG31]